MLTLLLMAFTMTSPNAGLRVKRYTYIGVWTAEFVSKSKDKPFRVYDKA